MIRHRCKAGKRSGEFDRRMRSYYPSQKQTFDFTVKFLNALDSFLHNKVKILKFSIKRKMIGLMKTLIRGLQKPAYDVVNKTENYEERCYKSAKWVSTTVKNISHKDGASEGFRRLFRYISGDNEKEVKVEMTAPVTTWVEPGAGPNCESSFTVAFYIPEEHQNDPPKPSNSAVFIEERPQFSAFVTTFGGFANDEIWVEKAVELGNAIGDHSKFNDAQYYTAGYDPPFKPFGRTNEVWFVKRDTPLVGSSVDHTEQQTE